MPIPRTKSSSVVCVRQTLSGVAPLARKLGVTPGHLSRVIRGERKSPRLERLLRKYGMVKVPEGAAS